MNTDHLFHVASGFGNLEERMILTGQENNVLVYYSGAISKNTEKPVELLYATNSKIVLGVTWGHPQEVGTLEILNLRGSIALQELSGVSEGMGGWICCCSYGSTNALLL